MEWEKILMGYCKSLFLQVQPNFFRPPKTYVAPGVGHGASYTFYWTSVGYPEPIGGCNGSAQ
jgi:hypothetical protein